MIKIELLLIILLVQIVFPQEKRKLSTRWDYDYKYISTKELMRYNISEDLDTARMSKLDSIETCSWKDRYWFFFKINNGEGCEDEFCEEFFVYNKNQKHLKQVTNRKFNLYTSHRNIHVFNGQLFLDAHFTETDHVYDYGILKIDDKDECEGKYIKVLEGALHPLDMYIQSDSLYIKLQKNEAKWRLDYYIFFWVRDPPPKYSYIEIGNPYLFVFDNNFKLVRKEE